MYSYPVNEIIPQLRSALSERRRAVLTAPTGSGKTTIIPLALLDEHWMKGRSIIMLEPRRLATRAAAERMAALRGEKVGQTVGYRIRFEQRVSSATRIEVVTEGILTRRLQNDPELKGVGLVIFDEFHERNLHGDLALALCLDGPGTLRDDLRMLVMSATLDTGETARMLDQAPVIEGEGVSYPVEVSYLPRPADEDIASAVASGLKRALSESQGDILAFLPGVAEIRRAEEQLQGSAERGIEICPLYGDLEHSGQLRAIRPSGGARRVVLATSIAETSLTIEGIRVVVDSGWSRRPRFDPNSGLTRLETVRVSRAGAEQRAGRAGRVAPGRCYRLWAPAVQATLAPHHSPEIVDADLSHLVLELIQWGVRDPSKLLWITPPPAGAFAQGLELLQRIGALNAHGALTSAGERMAALPVHPRLAAMMLEGVETGQERLAADLAALISERDILPRQPGIPSPADLDERVRLLCRWRERKAKGESPGSVDARACSRVERASREWQKRLPGPLGEERQPPLSIGALLALAYPDRIAQAAGGDGTRYRLVTGRGARLDRTDHLIGTDYLVIAQLDAGMREGRIFRAAGLTLDEIRTIRGEHISERREIRWEPVGECVVAQVEERLEGLILSSRKIESPEGAQVLSAMIDGIRTLGIDALPWTDSARAWQARILSLREWTDAREWPDVSDGALMAGLEKWLGPWLPGVTRREQLKRVDLLSALRGILSWDEQRRMDELAPTHLRVPSGSMRRIRYSAGQAPVLAVKLQEMFGTLDTPRICGGRIPLVLHLLSPAQRPVQVTGDLRGFWDNTYQEVRKELKGRYPKHYWPDDPLTAVATARVRPK